MNDRPNESTPEPEGALRARIEAAEQASRTKDQVLALAIHELRNPLMGIRNAVAILRLQALAEPAGARAVETVDRQSQQLTRLLQELADWCLLQEGKLFLRKQPVDLGKLVGQIEPALRSLCAAQELRLEVHVTQPPALLGEGDPVRLQQVVTALVQRAVKYTPAGGSVRLEITAQDNDLLLRVRDTGFGLSPEAVVQFFDTNPEGPRPAGAAGVGVLVARGLVELHGGSLRVCSQGPGQGAELTLHLPRSADPAAAAPRSTEPAKAARTLRVLCVDDDADLVESMAELLRERGHEARVARSGARALALAQAWHPQVVLLDLELPDMDGYALASRLRGLPGLESVRLVAVSGHGREEDRRRSRDAGIDHHLVKPVKAADLEAFLGLPQDASL